MLGASIRVNKVSDFTKALWVRHVAKWKTLPFKTAAMILQMGVEASLKLSDYKSIPQNYRLMLAYNDETVSKEETLAFINDLPSALFILLSDFVKVIEKVDLAILLSLIKKK